MDRGSDVYYRSELRELPSLCRSVTATLFARRHESPAMRAFARAHINDAKLWKRLAERA